MYLLLEMVISVGFWNFPLSVVLGAWNNSGEGKRSDTSIENPAFVQ